MLKVTNGRCEKCGKAGLKSVRATRDKRLQAKLRLSGPETLVSSGGKHYCRECCDNK